MSQDETIRAAHSLMDLVKKAEKLSFSHYTESLDLFSECYQVIKNCKSEHVRLAVSLLVFTNISSSKEFENRADVFEAFATVCKKLPAILNNTA